MRDQCAIRTWVAGRDVPSASPAVERRYDRRSGVYAHTITHCQMVTYRDMRARDTSYARA